MLGPPLVAARMQRWALLLSAQHCEIEYCSTQAHGNADVLSRLLLTGNRSEVECV